MPSFTPIHAIALAAVALLPFATPSESAAAAFHWNSTDSLDVWHDPANWLEGAVPTAADSAFLGLLAGIENTGVRIQQPVFITDLVVEDGMALLNISPGGVHHPISVSGSAVAGGFNFPDNRSAIRLFRGPTAYDLRANDLAIDHGAELDLRSGAIVEIDDIAFIGSSGVIEGEGVINLRVDNDVVTLRNSGAITPLGAVGLTFNQLGAGLFDLDGLSEAGALGVVRGTVDGGDGPARLTFNGTGLSDTFSGQIRLATGRSLAMNLSDGWTADAQSEIRIEPGSGSSGPAVLSGGHLTLEGRLRVFRSVFESSVAWADIESEVTINDSASIEIQEDALSFDSKSIINGGTFTLEPDSSLTFQGETIVRSGDFSTPSMDPNESIIRFSGETRWDGTVSFVGAARQIGDATVAGLTVINADLFDMDGPIWLSDKPTWNVNSTLTVNADSIDSQTSNAFRGDVSVAGNALAKLTINLADPTDYWQLNGTLNLNNNLPFGATRVSGSAVEISGELSINGSDIRVDADATFAPDSTTRFITNDSSLIMRRETRVEAGATFVADGLLGNAAAGHMTLYDGVSTDDVGLSNAGLLDIDDAAGIVAVDRFENTSTGTLAIDIGGYLLGDEFDHLQVAGEAAIDGALMVDLLLDEFAFYPEIGDEFMILTSLGGVSGEFANVLPTFAEGSVYGWEVLYHPHDVTIRLAKVGPAVPEPGSLAMVAFACVSLAGLRRRVR
ncbi:PEP-CTERM sorting domain-containing protein [Bythopirellula goksoeyrii]|uniref:PEP-CTERM protein-sorting domain-containing protein n=1 Tax=Bythopirellula goksoeyrii TaxID=1400387 RepID=A0A5B9QGU1_9BACT|nr:PEP-CTERM sorting domain-containing protein [Bythopirellula goksoeyrii]QEG38014.1 hypothetical protein Pr1d_53620 [Bythopirellula goksoeyrii]